MQEPDATKDAEIENKANKILSTATTSVNAPGQPVQHTPTATTHTANQTSRIGELNHQELLSQWLLEPAAAKQANPVSAPISKPEVQSTTPVQNKPAPPHQVPVQNQPTHQTPIQPSPAINKPQQPLLGLESTLQSILAQSLAQMLPPQGPSLTAIIVPEDIERVVQSDPSIIPRLLPYLPEQMRTPTDLIDIIHSPQFLQAIETLGNALEGSSLQGLLAELGVDARTLGPNPGADAILNEIQAKLKGNPSS